MPTTTGGLNFTYPSSGATGWNAIAVTMFNVISAHDHTGAPNGAQIASGAIAANAVTDAEFRLDNDAYLRARNNADSADISILKVNTSDEVEFNSGTVINGVTTLHTTNLEDLVALKDTNANTVINLTATGSAVNYLDVANSATGNAVTLSTAGSDSNVGLDLDLKGTGQLTINGSGAGVTTILDEDDLTTDSDTALATQQSIKAYVDAEISGITIPDAGALKNFAVASTTTPTSTSTAIPIDNTIPQNTEGAQILTVSITPTSATSTLIIRVYLSFTSCNANQTLALFQDSTASALAATLIPTFNGNTVNIKQAVLTHTMTSGTTSSTTFNVRWGPQSGTAYLLQTTSSAPLLGGVDAAVITVEEMETS